MPELEAKKAYDAALKKQEAGGDVSEAELTRLGRVYGELRDAEEFTGDQLSDTGVVRDQKGQWVVSFEFKTERKPAFTQFTTTNTGQLMAIILDGKVDSAPIIRDTLPGSGVISGGGNFGFKFAEAHELSIVLESGATGVTLEELRKETLGPSLGQDAIHRGQISIVGGFIVVLILMLWFYRMPGMIANLALLLNVLILGGTLAFFHAALSLPGIAGIVLTLGMAVDANILIFERPFVQQHLQRRRDLGVECCHVLATAVPQHDVLAVLRAHQAVAVVLQLEQPVVVVERLLARLREHRCDAPDVERTAWGLQSLQPAQHLRRRLDALAQLLDRQAGLDRLLAGWYLGVGVRIRLLHQEPLVLLGALALRAEECPAATQLVAMQVEEQLPLAHPLRGILDGLPAAAVPDDDGTRAVVPFGDHPPRTRRTRGGALRLPPPSS